MADNTTHDSATADIDAPLSIADPEQLRERDDVLVTQETAEHDDFDHCAADIAGRVVVALENDDGEFLVLVNDELGIALLPHGDVEGGEDWAIAAREETEALTGLSVSLDGIELLREVDHVVDPDGKPHRTTYRLILLGHPVGGEIQECKRSAEAGSDGWRAAWVTGLPEEITAPDDGPGDDLRYVLG